MPHRPTRPLPATLATALALGSLPVAVAPPAAAADATAAVAAVGEPRSAAAASDVVSRVNALRASLGRAALARHGTLDAAAAGWAAHLAQTGVLAHDPGMTADLTGLAWTAAAENVAYGGTLEMAWSALVSSPAHHANMVDARFTHVGVGVVVDPARRVWIVQRFATLAGAPAAPPPPAPAPPPPPPPPPPPAPAPAPTPAPAPAPPVPAPGPTAPPATSPPVVAPSPAGEPSDRPARPAARRRLRSVASHPSADARRVSAVIAALRRL